MDIDKTIEKYLGESSINQFIDPSKVMTGLFGGREKKKLLMKAEKFWEKLQTAMFISSKEREGQLGLNDKTIKKILKQQGFDEGEIEYIKKITIQAARDICNEMKKKYGVKISEIPGNFQVYSIVMGSKGWSGEVEDEWEEKFRKEVQRRLSED